VAPIRARRLPGRGRVRAERTTVEGGGEGVCQSRACIGFNGRPRGTRRAPAAAARALEDSAGPSAGRAVAGFVKVEQMISRAGRLVDRCGRGRRRRHGVLDTLTPAERLGDAVSLGGVFGREQAVYVAVAHDDRSGQFIQRIAGGAARWRGYRLNGAG
jgi:hypothetical protein